jgi:hypothetical protein
MSQMQEHIFLGKLIGLGSIVVLDNDITFALEKSEEF